MAGTTLLGFQNANIVYGGSPLPFKIKGSQRNTKGQRTILRVKNSARGAYHCPKSLTAGLADECPGRWLRSPQQTQARVVSFHDELAYFTGLKQFVKTKIHAQVGDKRSNRNGAWSVISF
jgi:hypothetical protein